MSSVNMEEKIRKYYNNNTIPNLDVNERVMNKINNRKTSYTIGRNMLALTALLIIFITAGFAISRTIYINSKDGSKNMEYKIVEDTNFAELMHQYKMELEEGELAIFKFDGYDIFTYQRPTKVKSLLELNEKIPSNFQFPAKINYGFEFSIGNIEYDSEYILKSDLIKRAKEDYKDNGNEFELIEVVNIDTSKIREVNAIYDYENNFESYSIGILLAYGVRNIIYHPREDANILTEKINIDGQEILYTKTGDFKQLLWIDNDVSYEIESGYEVVTKEDLLNVFHEVFGMKMK